MTRQASRYLRLTAFAGLLLAMVAVFLSVSGLMEQRVTAVATLKALGASSRLVLQSYLLLLVLTALIAWIWFVRGGWKHRQFVGVPPAEIRVSQYPTESVASTGR